MKINLFNGARVKIVSKNGSYKGRYFAMIGTVINCDYVGDYVDKNTVGIKLDNIDNPASKHNCFWFKRNEFVIISSENNIEMESESMSTVTREPVTNIINLWKDNQHELLLSKYKEIYENNIVRVDPRISNLLVLINDFNKKLAEYQKEYEVNLNLCRLGNVRDLYKGIELSHDSALLVEELNNKKTSIESQINQKAQETLVMVSACETYEQQMEILKRYNIIHNNLKLNREDQFELILHGDYED